MYHVGAKSGTDRQQIAKLGAEGEVEAGPDDRPGDRRDDRPLVPVAVLRLLFASLQLSSQAINNMN